MKKVLVVSYNDDSHKDCFVETARLNGTSVVLFDAGGYPSFDDEISVDYTKDKEHIEISLSGQRILSEEVVGIWWRRPRGQNFRKDQGGFSDYVHLEGEVLIRSLSDLLPKANWVSDPEATRLACRKPVQLAIAKSLGIKIPLTCLGNSPDSIKKFIKYLDGKKMIVKPVGTSFIDLSKDGKKSKVVFTKIVDPNMILDNINMVKNCPVIFQEAVEKDFDLRITVVDEEVFCAKVVLEGCSDTNNVDWRNHDGNRVYERYNLPEEISNQCVLFTKAMGLRFGCIDMAFSKENGYTLFEINPQGQWLPSEYDLGYPISTALLKSLTKS